MSDKKGYWIAHVNVNNPEEYQEYASRAPAAIAKYGGVFLARAGKYTELEGALGRSRNVVTEFPSYQAAVDCFNSPEYQEARSFRLNAGEVSITIVEGA